MFIYIYTVDVNHSRCEGTTEDLPACELEDDVKEQHCGMIEDQAGLFKDCIAKLGEEIKDLMADCVMDVCENKGDPDVMKKMSCDSYGAFAEICEDQDVVVDWRAAAKCGKYLTNSVDRYYFSVVQYKLLLCKLSTSADVHWFRASHFLVKVCLFWKRSGLCTNLKRRSFSKGEGSQTRGQNAPASLQRHLSMCCTILRHTPQCSM